MSRFQTVNVLFANAGLEGVMGYYRPVSQYNKGKKSEYAERKWFTESKACPCDREEAA